MKKILLCSTALIGFFLLSSAGVRAQESKTEGAGGPEVTQLKLGTAIQDREISGEDSVFSVNQKVYVWMRVTGASGDSIVVTWKHADKSYGTAIPIGSNSWRTWAYKTMSASGDWTVTVATQSGDVLKEVTFTVK